MKLLKTLIVDDERLARSELRYLLQPHPEIEIVGEAGSVDEALAAVERLCPDLIFLDIQMGGESGFDLFERARLAAQVVFVTAHDTFALRAFEVNALDYLMKPVNPERLRQAVERSLGRASAQAAGARRLVYEDSIFLSIDQAPRFVRLASLVCICAEGDYTRLVGAAGSIGMVLKPMKEWEQILPERQFCRIQRSAIINCEHVLRFEAWFNGTYQVHLKHLAQPLVMSRRYARRFRARFEV
jgi:two-component system LytT family response regulator